LGSVKAIGCEFLNDIRIAWLQHNGASCIPDKLGRALDHIVPLASLPCKDLSGRGNLEALLNTALRFHLGHFASFLLYLASRTAECTAQNLAAPPFA
jgi:hypothetical protein